MKSRSAARKDLPERARLRKILEEILESGEVEILQRRVCPHGSYPKESVLCRLADDSELNLFLKYSTPRDRSGYGHRGGLSYEARVYEHVLEPGVGSHPRFFGTASQVALGAPLVLSALEGFKRLRHPHYSTLIEVVRWLADFHRVNEVRVCLGRLSFLRRYDRTYYKGWSRRTLQLFSSRDEEFPWLTDLCHRFETELIPLLLRSSTVIHGEFTTGNVLIGDEEVCPIDWESAAIGPGEIDLAMLVDGWSDPRIQECAFEYGRVRWPNGVPSYYQSCFDSARVYVHLRWLGDPKWTISEKRRWRFRDLRAIALQRGLLQTG